MFPVLRGVFSSGCWVVDHVLIGEVLLVVVGVVVVEIDSLHRVIIVLNLHEAYHVDLSGYILGTSFFLGGRVVLVLLGMVASLGYRANRGLILYAWED